MTRKRKSKKGQEQQKPNGEKDGHFKRIEK